MSYHSLIDIGLFRLEDTPAFDRVVTTAKAMFQCKVSLLSLIDEANDRQFFKAECGLPRPWCDLRETPLSHSFCKAVATSGKTLIVSDARSDARFQDNPAVQELGVVAYLGVPVRGRDGATIAALCVIDTKPRAWTSRDVDVLQALGEGVTNQIGLMLTLRRSSAGGLQRDLGCSDGAIMMEDSSAATLTWFQGADGSEQIDQVSAGCSRIWEISGDDFKARFGNVFAMCLPEDIVSARASLGQSVACSKPWKHQWRIALPSRRQKWLRGYGQLKILPGGGIIWIAVVQDVTPIPEAPAHCR